VTNVHDAEALLTPAQQAARLSIARTTLLSIVKREGLPAILLSGGDGRRRILRFNPREVSDWLAQRRERQIRRRGAQP
jgi:helix-turn-helix protein